MVPNVISLIIPTFNEENAIPVVLDEVLQIKDNLSQFPEFSDLEVIVVDDGSADKSAAITASYTWVKLIKHERNLGYGAAIKTGIHHASGNLIAFMDMDATYHAADILSFSRELQAKGIDMIVGDRQLDPKTMPPIRRFGNWLLTELTSAVSSQEIKDCCSGIRVVRASRMKEIAPQLPDTLDFALALTLDMIRSGAPFQELPTTFKKRIGYSKLSEFFDGIRFFVRILYSRLSLHSIKNKPKNN